MTKIILGLNTKPFNSNIFRILLIATLVISVELIVAKTGGAPNIYLHLIYIPIILAGHYWGIPGGVSVALVGGILASPLMPLGIAQGAMQSDNKWIVRLIIMIIVGLVSGYAFKKVDQLCEQKKHSKMVDPFTGAYNTNKLIDILEKKIGNREKFVMVAIKLTNIEQISKYIEQKSAKDIANKANNIISELSDYYGKDAVYMSGYNEINLVLPLSSGYFEECKQIIERYSTPFKADTYTFRLLIKIGIYEYSGTDETPIQVYNKARIAYDQGNHQEIGIYLYDKDRDLSKQEFIEISSSLLEAISDNELYLVYQPKINIADNLITGVEVLTRWDRKGKKPVGPNVFIKIAEEIGFIKEISNFVLDGAYQQMLDWNNKGIVIDYSINFTANELLEYDFTEWEREATDGKQDFTSKLEIEITERVLSQDNDRIIERIDELRAKGIRISIDDFGTGTNSLIRAAQFPYDQIKIEKYFVQHIDDLEIRELIKEIINHTHKFGRKVVAEGVETEEQYNILKALKCDIAQGYYYSKPLTPDEFEQYYLKKNHHVGE